ncbi:MAG: TniB family NTP-binding protein [Burkholderiales bacterium]|nr:TniB family NTP-binding protein [Burkholderiales bacterium]
MDNNVTWKLAAHQQFKDLVTKLDTVFRSASSDQPRMLRLVGVSGVGKSVLLKEYARLRPPQELEDGWRIPVLYTSLPAHPTEKTLLAGMLRALGDPEPTYGTATQQRLRLLKGLAATGTQLLIVDEVQHFVKQMYKSTRIADAADTFKTLTNEYRGGLVLSGAPSSRILFQLNSQLRSRMPCEIRLRPFRWDDDTSRSMFLAVLKRQFPLGFENDDYLLTADAAHRVWYATDGVLRAMSQFVRALQDLAPFEKALSRDLLGEAFRAAIWAEPPAPRDPFGEQFTWTRLNLPGEPYAIDPKEGDNHA